MLPETSASSRFGISVHKPIVSVDATSLLVGRRLSPWVRDVNSQNNEKSKYGAWILTPAPLVVTKPTAAKPLRFQSRQKLGLGRSEPAPVWRIPLKVHFPLGTSGICV